MSLESTELHKQSSSDTVWSEKLASLTFRELLLPTASLERLSCIYTKDLGVCLALGVGSSFLIPGMQARRRTSFQVRYYSLWVLFEACEWVV